MAEGKRSIILKVKFDPGLYNQISEEARKHNIDVSTYVRWCAETGLYLEDLSSFIRSRSKEKV